MHCKGKFLIVVLLINSMYTCYTSFIIPCQKYDTFNTLEEKILKQNRNYIEGKNYNFIDKTIYYYAQ